MLLIGLSMDFMYEKIDLLISLMPPIDVEILQ